MPNTPKKDLKRIFIIPKELDDKLRKLAYESKRSRSDIVRKALDQYLYGNEAQKETKVTKHQVSEKEGVETL